MKALRINAALLIFMSNKGSVFQTADSHCDHTCKIKSPKSTESNKHHIFSFQIITDSLWGNISPLQLQYILRLWKIKYFSQIRKLLFVNIAQSAVLTTNLQVFFPNFHGLLIHNSQMNFQRIKISKFPLLIPKNRSVMNNRFFIYSHRCPYLVDASPCWLFSFQLFIFILPAHAWTLP